MRRLASHGAAVRPPRAGLGAGGASWQSARAMCSAVDHVLLADLFGLSSNTSPSRLPLRCASASVGWRACGETLQMAERKNACTKQSPICKARHMGDEACSHRVTHLWFWQGRDKKKEIPSAAMRLYLMFTYLNSMGCRRLAGGSRAAGIPPATGWRLSYAV